jgi:SAM-dependent methyltransferase
MLAIAGAKPPPDDAAPITYLECPAQALVVADESFDVATCQHGLQFFGDRVAALAEIHRALRPGGRLGVAVWADIGRQPPFDAVHQAIRVVLGDDTADRYRDGAWALGDPDLLVATAREAGFTEARVQERTLPLVLEGGIDRLLTTVAATGVAGDIAALDPDRAAALRAATAEAAGALVVEGTIRSSATALWLFATR